MTATWPRSRRSAPPAWTRRIFARAGRPSWKSASRSSRESSHHLCAFARVNFGAHFGLSTSKGQKYSLLKNDGYKLIVTAYADDNPPAIGSLIINARNRIQLWLTADAGA